MKLAWIACLSVLLMACQGNTQQKAQLKTQTDSISYAIGLDIGRNLKQQSIDFEPAILSQGIKDASDSGKALLNEQQSQQVMMTFQKMLVEKQQQKAKILGEKNKKEGDMFLAANKLKEGVKTTASGLQYKVLTAGTGPKPNETQTVSVNYRGTLIDGTEFDNTVKRNEPATLPVNGWIKGFSEALQLMQVGAKWQVYIPAELAYGERGAGQAIPPNATLIFDLELLSIK